MIHQSAALHIYECKRNQPRLIDDVSRRGGHDSRLPFWVTSAVVNFWAIRCQHLVGQIRTDSATSPSLSRRIGKGNDLVALPKGRSSNGSTAITTKLAPNRSTSSCSARQRGEFANANLRILPSLPADRRTTHRAAGQLPPVQDHGRVDYGGGSPGPSFPLARRASQDPGHRRHQGSESARQVSQADPICRLTISISSLFTLQQVDTPHHGRSFL